MAANNTVKVAIVGDASSLEREARRAGGAMGEFEQKTTKSSGVALTAFKGMALGVGAAAALDIGKGLAESGLKMEALQAKSKVVFGESLKDVEKWASGSAAAMGVTRKELVGMAASTADLLKPMGFTTTAAGDMSVKLQELSGALSAWSGGARSAAEVSTILQKALLGERDGLKELGVSISEADIEAGLAAKGQKNLTGAVRQQAEAQETLKQILEKSTDAQRAWNDGSMDGVKAANEAKSRTKEAYETVAKAAWKASEATLYYLTATESVNAGAAKLEYTRAIGMADTTQLNTARVQDRLEVETILAAKLADKAAAEKEATEKGEELAKVTAEITKREWELFEATDALWGKKNIDIPAALDEVNKSLLDYYEQEKETAEVVKEHTASSEESQRAMIEQREAARELQDRMRSYADDVLAAAEQQAKLNGTTLSTSEKAGILRQALEDLAQKFPPLQGAVDDMIKGLDPLAGAQERVAVEAEQMASRVSDAWRKAADAMAEHFNRIDGMIVATADQMERQAGRMAGAAAAASNPRDTVDQLAKARQVVGSDAMKKAIGVA